MRTRFDAPIPTTSRLSGIAPALVVGLLSVACNGDQSGEAEATSSRSATTESLRTTAGPDTTAEAVWAHLQEEAYRDNWALWPGTEQLYPGTEPHGMLLTTYTNSVAQETLADGDVADLPAGSIIVKENFMPDSTFAASTVMYKVEGYNPDHDDWLFAKYDPEGGVEAFGRAEGCQACHQEAETGYIYTEVQP